jgi:uncharacterized protein with von Willebrand factor type A (vWA) domain
MDRLEMFKMLGLDDALPAASGSSGPTPRPTLAGPGRGGTPHAMATDLWTDRRGQDLRAEREDAEDGVSAIDLADFHAALFNPHPELLPACSDGKKYAYLNGLLETPEFKALRTRTTLEAEATAAAAQQLGNAFAKLKAHKPSMGDAHMDRKDDGRRLPDDMPCDRPAPPGSRLAAARARKEREAELEEELAIDAAIFEATEDAADEVALLKDALGGCGMGPGLPGGKPDPTRALRIYHRIRKSATLRDIMERAGRLRMVAQSAQRQKTNHGVDDMVGVILDGEISRLISSELAWLAIEETELETLRRLVENQAMCREYRGLEPIGAGPVIGVVDCCLHPSTLVAMADGSLKPIASVNVGDEVLSFDFAAGQVIRQNVGRVARIQSPSTLHRIHLSEGTIIASGEHRFFVSEGGKIVERQLKDLAPRDLIAVPRDLPDPGLSDDQADVLFAQGVGYLLGDGDAWFDRNANSKRIHATDKDVRNLETYADIFQALDYRPLLRTWGGRNRLCLNSAKLYDLIMEEFPGLLNYSPERVIPHRIYRWDNTLVAAFLRGLFDAEGSVADHQIAITMSSKAVIDGAQHLLKRFGIITSRDLTSSGFVDHDYHRLLISGGSIDTFAEHIGFGSAAKVESLKAVSGQRRLKGGGICQRTPLVLTEMIRIARSIGVQYAANNPLSRDCRRPLTTRYTATRVINDIDRKLEAIRSVKLDDQYDPAIRRIVAISQATMSHAVGMTDKQVKRMDQGYNVADHRHRAGRWLHAEIRSRVATATEALSSWGQVLSRSLTWSRIQAIEEVSSDTDSLYDLTMDGSVANYIAGGCIVHNSGSMHGSKVHDAKALCLTIAWIARKQNRWCGLVAYSGDTGHSLLALPPSGWDEEKLLDWLEYFAGGGSNLDIPVREMPEFYERLGAPKGKTDLVFVTDAICNLHEYDRDRFNAWKQEAQARLVTLVLRLEGGDLSSISDEVHYLPAIEPDGEAVRRVLSL